MEQSIKKIKIQEDILEFDNTAYLNEILKTLYGQFTTNTGPNPKDILIISEQDPEAEEHNISRIRVVKERDETDAETIARLILTDTKFREKVMELVKNG